MSHLKKVKHGYQVIDKKVPRNYQKAFAVATFISATLKTYPNVREQELLQLHVQVKRLMNVYHVEAGELHFDELTDKLGDIWAYLGTRAENNEIDEDDVPALLECLCMIVPLKDFKEMYAVDPFVRNKHMYFKAYPSIVHNVLELDKELNKLIGSKPYTLQKPKEKVAKVKKVRDKKKIVKEKKESNNNKAKFAKKKAHEAKRKQTLSEIIAQAKKRAEALHPVAEAV